LIYQEARELIQRYNANVNIAYGTGMAACFYRVYQEEKVDENAKAYPKSGYILYLGVKAGIITFKGRVRKAFGCYLL